MKFSEYKSSLIQCGFKATFIGYLWFLFRIRIVWPWLNPLRRIVSGLKGIMWCRRFHRPLLTGFDSYNGRDWTGRWRCGGMQRKRCLVCGNAWTVREDSKPLTWDQCVVGKTLFGNMWVGPKTPDDYAGLMARRRQNKASGGEE
jgi:hypothetical protein